jgi:ribosomal protein L40E
MAWQPPFLGPICPDCGAPLRSSGAACRHCGFSPHDPKELHEGIMTSFGYGFCGVGIGAMAAMVLRMADQPRLSPIDAILDFALALVMGRLTSWLGAKLAARLRCGYEHLLISLLLGGVASFVMVIAAPLSLATCGYIWLGVTLVTYPLMRRYGYRNTRNEVE